MLYKGTSYCTKLYEIVSFIVLDVTHYVVTSHIRDTIVPCRPVFGWAPVIELHSGSCNVVLISLLVMILVSHLTSSCLTIKKNLFLSFLPHLGICVQLRVILWAWHISRAKGQPESNNNNNNKNSQIYHRPDFYRSSNGMCPYRLRVYDSPTVSAFTLFDSSDIQTKNRQTHVCHLCRLPDITTHTHTHTHATRCTVVPNPLHFGARTNR